MIMSFANGQVELPEELTDMVIDLVAQLPDTDECRYPTLLSCHQVSRAFCFRSRVHLFSQINISTDQSSQHIHTTLSTLAQIMGSQASDLEGHPAATNTNESLDSYNVLLRSGIKPYIKRFFFVVTEPHVNQMLAELDWDGSFSKVLNSLWARDYGVSEFGLSFFTGALDWAMLDQHLQRSLLNIFQSPHLATLRLYACYNLPIALFQGSHFNHLDISHCEGQVPLIASPKIEDLVPINRTPIEILETNRAFPIQRIAYVGTPKNGDQDLVYLQPLFSQLKALSIVICSHPDYGVLRGILSNNLQSLETLELNFGSELPLVPFQSIKFHELPRLLCLKLTHSSWPSRPSVSFDRALQQVRRILNPASAQLHDVPFQTLQLNLTLDGWHPQKASFCPDKGGEWMLLSDLLCERRFNALKSFMINLELCPVSEDVGTDARQGDKEFVANGLERIFLPFLATKTRRLAVDIDLQVGTQ